jgi:hypothetical protein
VRLPKHKNAPKLPRKPTGGGAAARVKQFNRERGLQEANLDGARKPGDDVAQRNKTKNREEKDQ